MASANTTADSSSIKILVLNPNSSKSMTHGLEEALKTFHVGPSTQIDYYTAPSESPASINDDGDLQSSNQVVAKDLARHSSFLDTYDAILVACFSVHPLVHTLGSLTREKDNAVITGIFEAGIQTALSLIPPVPDRDAKEEEGTSKWGIVTTGKFWEEHLAEGVNTFLGTDAKAANSKFAGVETTGLNAGDFHGGVPQSVIDAKMKEATARLLSKGDVKCVVMGCAGMTGLDSIIRQTAIEKYGKGRGNRVMIIDGVKAGVRLLEQAVRNKRLFRGPDWAE